MTRDLVLLLLYDFFFQQRAFCYSDVWIDPT